MSSLLWDLFDVFVTVGGFSWALHKPMVTLPPLAPKSVSSREKNLFSTSLLYSWSKSQSINRVQRCWCHDCFDATDSCQSDRPNQNIGLSLSDDMHIKTSHKNDMLLNFPPGAKYTKAPTCKRSGGF